MIQSWNWVCVQNQNQKPIILNFLKDWIWNTVNIGYHRMYIREAYQSAMLACALGESPPWHPSLDLTCMAIKSMYAWIPMHGGHFTLVSTVYLACSLFACFFCLSAWTQCTLSIGSKVQPYVNNLNKAILLSWWALKNKSFYINEFGLLRVFSSCISSLSRFFFEHGMNCYTVDRF